MKKRRTTRAALTRRLELARVLLSASAPVSQRVLACAVSFHAGRAALADQRVTPVVSD